MKARLLPLSGVSRLLQFHSPDHFTKARCPPHLRPFHVFFPARASASSPTYYDTLGLSPSASQSDVKAKFYDLSKQHHPDHNPSDPEASTRFVAISVAYATIGNPDKRRQYDRDVVAPLQASSASGNAAPQQSHHGSGHAGGRKASGLSRRRAQFRGPPPSFYRSGGWGKHSAKRTDHASGAETQSGPTNSAAGRAYANVNGDGQGDYPFAATDLNDVPHFDRDGHYRVQSTIEEQLRQGRVQRRQTQAKQRQSQTSSLGFDFDQAQSSPERFEEDSSNQAGTFWVVTTIVIVSAAGSLLVLSGPGEKKTNKGKRLFGKNSAVS